jgi:hypothetical protein
MNVRETRSTTGVLDGTTDTGCEEISKLHLTPLIRGAGMKRSRSRSWLVWRRSARSTLHACSPSNGDSARCSAGTMADHGGTCRSMRAIGSNTSTLTGVSALKAHQASKYLPASAASSDLPFVELKARLQATRATRSIDNSLGECFLRRMSQCLKCDDSAAAQNQGDIGDHRLSQPVPVGSFGRRRRIHETGVASA